MTAKQAQRLIDRQQKLLVQMRDASFKLEALYEEAKDKATIPYHIQHEQMKFYCDGFRLITHDDVGYEVIIRADI